MRRDKASRNGWLAILLAGVVSLDGPLTLVQAARPPVPGAQGYVPLEFTAIVLDGPDEGSSWFGELLLRLHGRRGEVSGLLRLPDGSMAPVAGRLSDRVGDTFQIELSVDLGAEGPLALIGVVEQEMSRGRLVSLGADGDFTGPDADDSGFWTFDTPIGGLGSVGRPSEGNGWGHLTNSVSQGGSRTLFNDAHLTAALLVGPGQPSSRPTH